jgi:hypothetical protein
LALAVLVEEDVRELQLPVDQVEAVQSIGVPGPQGSGAVG